MNPMRMKLGKSLAKGGGGAMPKMPFEMPKGFTERGAGGRMRMLGRLKPLPRGGAGKDLKALGAIRVRRRGMRGM